VEIAGRERAPYGIATPWKLLDGLRIPRIDSRRRSHKADNLETLRSSSPRTRRYSSTRSVNDPVDVTCSAAELADPSDIAAHSSLPLVASPDNASVGTDKATRVLYDSIVSAPALCVLTQDR
jgi:hypothetical protein